MRRRRVVLVALVAVATVVLAGRAPAQQTDKQRQLTDKHADLSASAAAAGRAALEARDRKAALEATIGDLEARVVAAQAALTAAEAEVERLAFEALLLVGKIDDTRAKLADAEADTKASAVLLYKRPDSASATNLIGSTQGAGSLVEARQYLKHVSEKRRNDLARAERLRAALDAQQTELTEQQRQADEVRAQADAARIEIEALYARQRSARDSAAQQEQIAVTSEATYSAEAVQVAAALEEENERVRALLQSLPADTPPMGNGQLIRPVGGSLASGFGYRSDPISGAQAFHAGIDFGASCGTPVKAAGNGVVVSAGWQGGYGNATIINHGGGMATLYGHQSGFSVGAGQSVTAGQVIGSVGSTGKSTGCHLHFEVRISGNPVDPRQYL